MKRIHPLAIVAAVLFVVSLGLSLFTVGEEDVALARSASVYDASPGGVTRLRSWLGALGVETTTLEGSAFQPDLTRHEALLLLGATQPITPQDLDGLRAYVRSGGTLVVATDVGLAERPILDAFGVRTAGALRAGEHAVGHIALAAPPVRSVRVDVGTRLSLTGRAEPLAGRDEGFVASTVDGRGAVVVVGSLAPFLNGTIGEADNGRLVLNLLGSAKRIAFDEYHHGVQARPDQLAVLTRTWPGRALIAAGVATFLYLLASGRRLGPPVPLDPRPPRSSLDYVRGLAGLVRRSGRGEIARRRLADDLRRGLARRVGLDGRAPMEQVIAALAAQDAGRAAEAGELDALLREGRSRPDELLRIVARVERLIASDS